MLYNTIKKGYPFSDIEMGEFHGKPGPHKTWAVQCRDCRDLVQGHIEVREEALREATLDQGEGSKSTSIVWKRIGLQCWYIAKNKLSMRMSMLQLLQRIPN